ncbi:MAG: Fe2+-dependent dioxygenase [Rudaea sp.]|uniref:Fe2+-dependent dioxygenase n=1 Tax=unclassified Rudaea TaxID=2627037 RepID=UPI0010F8C847|nr:MULTISPECIES: Fe2+-dependent dioxygenase [unclassified Rudaea]MBN8886406.1 Fe2+-dependent dioxygenase [Rudaea sp.]MBR0343725.1 Fe2+-dependent dioxygenase [Rudaea sp.]
MLLHIENVLDAAQIEHCRRRLDGAAWSDGRITAGHQSARAKNNGQLPESDPLAQELAALVLDAVGRHPTFFAGALPRRIYPPLFNRYADGQAFGFHVDNAVRYDRSSVPAEPVRTDLSVTLFLSDPDDYDGGELVIEDTYGEHRVKLPAGDLVIYPGSSLHRVEPVTRGARVASFFWVQSFVRSAAQRRTLFELDVAIQQLTRKLPAAEELVRLTGVYHNLLREWSDV